MNLIEQILLLQLHCYYFVFLYTGINRNYYYNREKFDMKKEIIQQKKKKLDSFDEQKREVK